MAQLIEIDDAKGCAPSLCVKVGDLLVFSASGGRMNTSGSALRYLGAFMRAVVGTNRKVLEPMGLPNAVVFEVLQHGQAAIDVISGGPFGNTSTTTLLIIVRDQ